VKPSGALRRTRLARGTGLERRSRISPVSSRRRRENRERAAMADARWPGRRDGTVLCAAWEAIQPDWCDRWASDLHERLSRGRAGSITDPENCVPLCRSCHTRITDGPESEIGWAFRLALVWHSALCCQGRRVCSRYQETGDAA
jgi:HNH endonuclease